ncbi:MAG: hypothetical protein ACI9JR_000285 [Gammaproteobacteria bacterium]|jgi:hypothetical protein
MMKKNWKPTLFFVFCLVIFLIIKLPVALILKQVELPSEIKLYGVKGQITSGHIAAAYVNNFPIRDINYEADLSCLLTLQVCYQINYQNGTANISFNPLTNSTVIKQVDIEYSMAEFAPLMNQLLVKPTGELNLKFNQISVKHLINNSDVNKSNANQIKIDNIDGQAIWNNAGVVGEGISLGDYQLGVLREDDSYRFKLTDIKAVLNIDGTGRLKPNGEYLIDIKILADLGLDDSIKSILTLIAKKKGLNEYSIYRQGQLPAHLISLLSFSEDI